jgi:hypothetical protein
MTPVVRSTLVLLLGGAALAFATDRVVQSPAFRVPRDYFEYWSAGRLSLRGENPYDPHLMLVEQQRLDPAITDALMMWNPPPALALYAPFGCIPPRTGALIWIGLQLFSIMVACDWLWRIYAPEQPRWVAQLVALSFVGTWWVVAYGQNTGFLLLGLAGFLHYTRKERPIAAGAFAALTALKPHLLAGFGVLLLADALTRRGRIALGAGIAVIAVGLGLALAMNSAVIAQFVAAVRDPGPGAVPLRNWSLPLPSYWLRMRFAPDQFWVQFVPSAIACASLLVWRFREGTSWNWPRALPVVVTISVLVAPYGGWIFDLPILLVPAVWCAARLSPLGLAFFLSGQVTITTISFATPGALHDYWWVTPAVLTLCLLPICRMLVAVRDSHGSGTCLAKLPSTRS